MPSYGMVRHRGNHYQPPILPRGSGLLIKDPMPSAGVGGVGVPARTEAARIELRGGRQKNFKGQARGRQAAPASPSPVLMAS